MNEDKIGVGDEVLCIDASLKPGQGISIFPVWIKESEKYIVREVMTNDDIVVGITLEGRRNPPVYIPLLKRMQEPAYAMWRFRKTKSAYMIEEEKETEGVGVEIKLEEI